MERVTLAEFAGSSGGKYDTFYRKAKRKFPAEAWRADSVLTAEHIAVLSGKSSEIIRRIVSGKPVSVESSAVLPSLPEILEPANTEDRASIMPRVRRLLVGLILIGAVLGHAGLIWYDCNALWGEPGTIGGGLVFLIVLAAVLFASDDNLPRTSGFALWFVFFIDVAAWWVHFPTFQTPVISDTITGCLCGFICACSWIALYLFRDSKLD